MDIIIRNGVIQKNESKKISEIKNKSGLLKKDYKDFVKNIPGPYYDFSETHICIPRWHYEINNFTGPQNKFYIKLNENINFNKSVKYCCICHEEIKYNKSFSSKRKIFIYEDIFYYKEETDNYLQEEFKKLKVSNVSNVSNNSNISNISNNSSNNIDLLSFQLNKTSIDITKKWINLYNKINKNNRQNHFNFTLKNYKNKQQKKKKIIYNYYKIVYKIIKNPILYNISNTETKLIWPWDLTHYQKYKLNNPNYKLTPIFSHNKNKITDNYIIIE